MTEGLSPERALVSRYVSQWSLRRLARDLTDVQLATLNEIAKKSLLLVQAILSPRGVFVWGEGEHMLSKKHDGHVRVTVHPSVIYDGRLRGSINIGVFTQDGSEPSVNDDVSELLLGILTPEKLAAEVGILTFGHAKRDRVWPSKGKVSGTDTPIGDRWFSPIAIRWHVELSELSPS